MRPKALECMHECDDKNFLSCCFGFDVAPLLLGAAELVRQPHIACVRLFDENP